MKRLGIVAAGLALVVGIVVGGMAGNPFDGKASASTAVQAREAQVTIGAVGATNAGPEFSFLGNGTPIPWIAFDPAKYPSSSAFRLELILQRGTDSTNCLRLFDLTADTAVDGSETCVTSAGYLAPTRLRSGVFTLPNGEHEYAIQGEFEGVPPNTCCGVDVLFSRIVVEWSEPFAVGGIAELPAVAGANGSGMGSATYAVLAGAAAGVLAFAVLARLSVKRRGVR